MAIKEVTEFACEGFGDCTKTFSRAEHLARHIRGHTGEKPFKCHCGRSFTRLDNVRQHAATVHADEPTRNQETMAQLMQVHNELSAARTLKPRIRRRDDSEDQPSNDGDGVTRSASTTTKRRRKANNQDDQGVDDNGLYGQQPDAYGGAGGPYDGHNPDTGSPLLASLAQAARSYSWTANGPSAGPSSGQQQPGQAGSPYQLPPLRAGGGAPQGPQGSYAAPYGNYQQQQYGYPSQPQGNFSLPGFPQAGSSSASNLPPLPAFPSVLQPPAYDPHNPYPEPEKPNQAHWLPPPVPMPRPQADQSQPQPSQQQWQPAPSNDIPTEAPISTGQEAPPSSNNDGALDPALGGLSTHESKDQWAAPRQPESASGSNLESNSNVAGDLKSGEATDGDLQVNADSAAGAAASTTTTTTEQPQQAQA